MLDKGEYLGNFVICKENSEMNDDFSWTVYQNDKVRALLNRSIALGKRLFCKIDQVGVHGAYMVDYRPDSWLHWVDDEDVILRSDIHWRVSFPMQGEANYVGSDEVAALRTRKNWDTATAVTYEFIGATESIGNIKVNGLTTQGIIEALNHQLERDHAPFEFRLSVDKKNLECIMKGENLNWNNAYLVVNGKPQYQNVVRVAWRLGFENRDNTLSTNHILAQLCDWKMAYTENNYSNIAYLKYNDHWDYCFSVPLRKWKIPQTGHLIDVGIDKMLKVPISDDSVYWYHPDFSFNNLNMNHFTGVFQNNKVLSYAMGEGPIYELVQLSATPKMQFFTYDQTRGSDKPEKVVAYVPDFHISLSFYTTRDDFTVSEMKYNYLGNFVISLENTNVDRFTNTIEVYQNDKVRNMLDRVHKKGKQLYARLDQISFETTERSDYWIEISEYRMMLDALREPTLRQGPDYKQTFRLTETYQQDADLWSLITLKIRNQPDVLSNFYTFTYNSETGVRISVEGGTTQWGNEQGVWRIEFCPNLQEDYGLPRAIFDPRMSLGNPAYQNVPFIKISTETIEDRGHEKYGCQRHNVLFTLGARNARFTSNQLYFYHPDLIGDNCNLEPLTVACQYPGTNQFHHPHYYYVRTLSAPTRIRFFHYVPSERTRPAGDTINYYYEYEKQDYIPAHFNVVISYYEGD